jgi:hypothetical protein
MMRLFFAVAVVLFAVPAFAVAAEPVIKVDCLCVAEGQGWVLGLSNATPSQAGIDKLKFDTVIVLSATENQCGKYPGTCRDDYRYQPVTGEVRTVLENYGYLATDENFKLNIEGKKASK